MERPLARMEPWLQQGALDRAWAHWNRGFPSGTVRALCCVVVLEGAAVLEGVAGEDGL